MHLPTALPGSDYGPNPLPAPLSQDPMRPLFLPAIFRFDLVIDAGIDHKAIRNRFNAERFQETIL
jgi:hypothetical protein